MFSFIAAYLNCVNARGKVCRIQTTSFLGIMFSFIGAGLKLRGRVTFRKYDFLYCGILELRESARQSMSYSNIFFRKYCFLYWRWLEITRKCNILEIVFLYCGILELRECARQSMSYPNNLFFYKIYFSIYLHL